ncbi:hypothetical protein QBE52_02925 [Clostridiaceae bacterium 35-E11]
MRHSNQKEANENKKFKIWPVILGAITYVILDVLFDIPNAYDLLKNMF